MSSLHSKPAGDLSAEASAGNAQPAKVSFAEFQAHGIHFSPEEQAVQQIAFSALIEKADPANIDRINELSRKYLEGTRAALTDRIEIDETEGMRLIENEAVAAEMLRLIGDEEALTMAKTIDRQIVEAREKFKRMIEAKRGISHLLDDATDSTKSAMRFHTDYGQINAAIKKSLPERSRQNPVVLHTEDMWHLWAISFCDINIIRKTNNTQNTTKGGLIVSQTMFEGSVTAKFQGFIANAARTHYTTADGANLIIQMRSGLNEIAAEAKSVTEGHPVQTVQDFQRMVDRFEKNLAVTFSGKPFITWHDFHEIIVRLCDQRMFAIDPVFNNVLVTEQSKVRIQQAFDRIADKAVKNEISLNSIIDAEQLEKYFTRDREIFQKTFDKCASKVPESARKALLDLIETFRVRMHDEARDKMIKPRGAMISSRPIRILSAGNVTDSSKDGSEPKRLVALNSNVDAVPEDIAAVKQVHSPKPMDAKYFLFLVRGNEIDEYTHLFDEEQVRLKRNFVAKYGSVVDSIIDVFERESMLICEGQSGDMTKQSHEKMCDDFEATWRRMKKNLEPYMDDEWVGQHVAQNEKGLNERRTYGLQLLQLPPPRSGKTVNSAEVRSTLVNGIRALSPQIKGDRAGTLVHNRFVVAMNEMFANYIPTELACQAEIDATSHFLEFQIRNECYNVKCLANNGVVPEAEGLDLSRIEDFETGILLLIAHTIREATVKLSAEVVPLQADTRRVILAGRTGAAKYLTPQTAKYLVMAQVVFETLHGTQKVQNVLEQTAVLMAQACEVRSYQFNPEQRAAYAASITLAIEEGNDIIRTEFPGPGTEDFIRVQEAPMRALVEAIEAYVEPSSGVVKLPTMPVIEKIRAAMKHLDRNQVPQSAIDAINDMYAAVTPWHYQSVQDLNDLELVLLGHIRGLSYNNPSARASLESLRDTDEFIRRYLSPVLCEAFTECRQMFLRLQSESRLKESNVAFEALASCDISKGLPKRIFADVICAASENADRELGVAVNRDYLKMLRSRISTGGEFVERNEELVERAAWIFGRTMAIDAIPGASRRGGAPSTELIAVRNRDVNIRHYEEAFQMVLRKCLPDYPDTSDLTLTEIAKGNYFAIDADKEGEWGISRDEIVSGIVQALRRVSVSCKSGKSKTRIPRDKYESWNKNEEDVVQSVQYFAHMHLPEKICRLTSLIALSGYLEEATFSWADGVKYDGVDATILNNVRNRLDQAYREVAEEWVVTLAGRQWDVLNRVYPIIVLPDPALKPVEKTIVQDPEFVAKLWKGKFSGLLAERSTSLAEGCLKEGAYFASLTQQTQTQSKLREYFGTLETAFHTAIDMACVESTGQLSGVPSTASLSRHLRQAIMSVMVPEGLAALFTDQLELLQVELEDFVVREFSDATSFSHILRIEGKTSGAWDEGLGSLFDKESSSGSEISLEKILPETASIKNRCTAAFVRTVLFESLQGRGSADAIPESAFSLTWIDKIHNVVSRSIDEYVAKEPRRGQFVEDVITTIFRSARQMALMARLGASVSQEFGTGGAALLPESVILKMRGITGVDMLSGQAPDCAGLRAEVLQITGRLEDLAILKSEDMALDQFLRQKLQSDEGTAADQLTKLIPDIESLVHEINCGCHMGQALRTTDWAYVLLSERADNILEEVIVLSSTHEIDVEQSPDAARLVALQTENDAWISSWPDAPKSSESHAGFLQVVTNWNGTAKAVSDGCRQGVVFDARTIATAILDAECVRDAREKNIVVVRENSGVRKPGMMVHHYKIRALLDLRAAKEIGLRALGSAGIDPRAASIVVDVHALTLELAALERTLGSTDEDTGYRDAASKILENKRREFGEAEQRATELESMLQETVEETETAMRELPHVLIALNAVIISETEMGAELRAGVRKAEQETFHASERLVQYTSTGGRDVEMLSEMSAAQSDAQSHESSIRAELEIFEFSDSVAMLSVERDALIGIGQEWEPADTAPAYSTDPKELAKSARRVRVTVEDRKSIQEARENARQVADVAKRNVEHLSALASDSSIVAGSRNSLQTRRRDIVGTLQHVRELLSALTQGK